MASPLVTYEMSWKPYKTLGIYPPKKTVDTPTPPNLYSIKKYEQVEPKLIRDFILNILKYNMVTEEFPDMLP